MTLSLGWNWVSLRVVIVCYVTAELFYVNRLLQCELLATVHYSAMYAGDRENSIVDRRQLYLRCCSECMPCPQALGYTLGKSLESGTFAKVKAAWSPFQSTMVRQCVLLDKNSSY